MSSTGDEEGAAVEPPTSDDAPPTEEELPPLEPPDDGDYDDTRGFLDNGGVLAVKLDGEGTGTGTIDVFTLGQVYTYLDRVQRGIMADLAGLEVKPSGRIPIPKDARPWLAATPARGSFELRF